MSTKAYYPRTEIGPGKVGFSKTRSIIEAPFYGNNVVKINSLREAYDMAKNSPGTIVTDMPVYRGEEFGLEPDAKVLLFNDGSITGRYAAARRITGKPGVDTAALDKIVMDAVYDTRWRRWTKPWAGCCSSTRPTPWPTRTTPMISAGRPSRCC